MAKPCRSKNDGFFEQLCTAHNLEFSTLSTARRNSDQILNQISDALKAKQIELSDALSLVVFGSLARGEWTSGSDVDWTLLVDGPVDPEHFTLVRQIGEVLAELKLSEPGTTGTFGSLTSSHDLVHHIGGLDDTNTNMTRRLLLLLESAAVINGIVRDRVIRSVLSRYILNGGRIGATEESDFRVPRFLLNDVVRYWRTIAVDYAAKKWEQQDRKWSIRNAKLRFTRKMTFVKGLLLCFDCEAFPEVSPWSDYQFDKAARNHQLVNGCTTLVEYRPIDLLARVLSLLSLTSTDVKNLLAPYDEFLKLLNQEDQRCHLEALSFENAGNDPLFSRIRKGIGRQFGENLSKLFFQTPPFSQLVQKYGLF